ncbi:MAG: hypothetical protein HY913_11595 [Desulfomonile tiedjei]|nr:hypothetical protein [Desulfomonile tiedjei]
MKTIEVRVTQEIADQLMADVHGQGGFQDLLRKLGKQLDLNRLTLTLDDTDLERIPRYKNYEPGGYEDRLVPLLQLLRAEGLVTPMPE